MKYLIFIPIFVAAQTSPQSGASKMGIGQYAYPQTPISDRFLCME
jgi:hypothetical protein